MKVFIAIVLLYGVSADLGNPEDSDHHVYTEPIGDHEVEHSCFGFACSRPNCRQLLGLDDFIPCPAVCQRGFMCDERYIRESKFGRCILLSRCRFSEGIGQL